MANWKVPTSGKVSQGFGADPEYYKRVVGQNGHNGIDYAVFGGTPVKATADGVVEFEGWGQHHPWALAPAGIYVLLKHSNGYSGYAHLSNTIVNKGQRVKVGQVIGHSGATGTVKGAHLHFETYPLKPNFGNGFAGRVNPSAFKLGVPDVKPKKFATVLSTANVRSQPRLKAPLSGSGTLKKGDRFEYTSIVKGDKVGSNDKWYKSAKGNYVWSGNVKG